MDISIRGPQGLGNAGLQLVWLDADTAMIGDAANFSENTTSGFDAFEAWYYVAGVTPPSGAVSYAAVAVSDGRVWAFEAIAAGGSIVIPVITGTASEVKLVNKSSLRLLRGDTYRLTFSLGADYSGYTGKFAAKLHGSAETDAANYPMPARAITWTNAATGTGYVDLSATDTAVVGSYDGEVQLTDGSNVRTPEQYTIIIADDVIK